jgi:hypothetical protein
MTFYRNSAIPVTPPIPGKMPTSIVIVAVPARIRRPVIAVRLMRDLVVWGRFVMKAQEIHAVVVAVGCPDDGMDVEFLRLRIVQHDAFMMIKLDHRHRTLNAIIKGALFCHAAGPAEMGRQEVPFDIVHSGLQGTGGQRG